MKNFLNRILRTSKLSFSSLAYSNENYKEAVTFNTAKKSLENSVKLSATYYHARSLTEINDIDQALLAFEELSKIEQENPYREAAILTLARTFADQKEEKKSISSFKKLLEISEREDIKAEALVKLGLMSNSLGNINEAKKYFSSALSLKEGDEWKPDAQFHLIKIHYQEKYYQDVIDTYSSGAFSMSDEIRPKMLLMVGTHSVKWTDTEMR